MGVLLPKRLNFGGVGRPWRRSTWLAHILRPAGRIFRHSKTSWTKKSEGRARPNGRVDYPHYDIAQRLRQVAI